jgi:hypothetical protein
MRAGMTIALAAAAIAVLSPSALAEPSFDSEVTIHFRGSDDTFLGKVSSSKSACVANRKVILYSKSAQKAPPVKLGSDRASGSGAWSVPQVVTTNYYFAKVNPKHVGAGLCKRDKSDTLTNPGEG